AAAALAASARAGVAPRRMDSVRAKSDSRHWHLLLRLVRCARRVQLLVRRIDRAGRDRRRADSARLARDASENRPRDLARNACARCDDLDFPPVHRRSAVLDRPDSAPRSATRRRTAPTARAFSGTLVHLRLARGQSFLENVPYGLRHDAGQGAEAAGALGYLSPDSAGDGDVHHGRTRARLHSDAADGPAAELS